jgi:hypothetical protein
MRTMTERSLFELEESGDSFEALLGKEGQVGSSRAVLSGLTSPEKSV